MADVGDARVARSLIGGEPDPAVEALVAELVSTRRDRLPRRRCPKARRRSGRPTKRHPLPTVHEPHEWHAGEYLPVGDLGYPAWCPGFPPC